MSVEAMMAQKPYSPIDMASDPNRVTALEAVQPATELIGDVYNSLRARPAEVITAGAMALGVFAAATAEGAAANPAPVVTVETPTVTITAASSAAESVATADLTSRTVLAFRSAKGTPAAELRKMQGKKNEGRCILDKNYWNSGSVLGKNPNNPTFFRDSRLSVLCKSKNSPTGWVRLGTAKNANVLEDGFQRSKDVLPGTDCWNIVRPNQKEQPKHVVKAPIVVRSFAEGIKLTVSANAKADAVCAPGTSAHGEASATATAKISVREMVKSRGQARVNFIESLKAQVSAAASAKARCETTTTPEKPPVKEVNIPPTIDVVDLQHMLVNGIAQVCAYAKDPNGLGDIQSVTLTESGDGNFISDVYAGNEPGEYCADFAAGVNAGEASVKGTVTDKAGNQATDTETWPIVAEPTQGQPGAF